MRRADPDLRCSFCQKAQNVVGKLISSPGDYPRAYICDECIAVCAHVIEDDKPAPAHATGEPVDEVQQLLDAVADWVQYDALGKDAAEELAKVHRLASSMLGGNAR